MEARTPVSPFSYFESGARLSTRCASLSVVRWMLPHQRLDRCKSLSACQVHVLLFFPEHHLCVCSPASLGRHAREFGGQCSVCSRRRESISFVCLLRQCLRDHEGRIRIQKAYGAKDAKKARRASLGGMLHHVVCVGEARSPVRHVRNERHGASVGQRVAGLCVSRPTAQSELCAFAL